MDEEYNKKLMMATQLFKDRASGKVLPDGEMNSDSIFILSPTERRACCSCMETRLDHRRSACSNFINKVRSRPGKLVMALWDKPYIYEEKPFQ